MRVSTMMRCDVGPSERHDKGCFIEHESSENDTHVGIRAELSIDAVELAHPECTPPQNDLKCSRIAGSDHDTQGTREEERMTNRESRYESTSFDGVASSSRRHGGQVCHAIQDGARANLFGQVSQTRVVTAFG
jgi:hypothetical protein